MREVVIVDGIRTPFVKAGTLFSDLGVIDLGMVVLGELLWRSHLRDEQIDEIVVGNGYQPIDAPNPAKVIAEKIGLRGKSFQRIPAYTVQRNCASGIEAIVSAYKDIALERRNLVLVIGVESMSSSLLLYPNRLKNLWLALASARTAAERMKIFLKLSFETEKQLFGAIAGKKSLLPKSGLKLGLKDPIIDLFMGETAEHLARRFEISREEQDKLALESHLKASRATKSGTLKQEMVPVFVQKIKDFVEEDNGIRHNQTLEALGKLRPVFDKKFGTVTAGNSSQITDGAAGLVLCGKDIAKKYGLPILGEIVDFEFAGCDPLHMGLGPVVATSKLFAKTGFTIDKIGLIEINEAFASQALSVLKLFSSGKKIVEEFECETELGEIPSDKLNVNGGAIALGHPIGATGVRMVLTILKEMERRKLEYGLATLCIGGGQGGAMILKREAENGNKIN